MMMMMMMMMSYITNNTTTKPRNLPPRLPLPRTEAAAVGSGNYVTTFSAAPPTPVNTFTRLTAITNETRSISWQALRSKSISL